MKAEASTIDMAVAKASVSESQQVWWPFYRTVNLDYIEGFYDKKCLKKYYKFKFLITELEEKIK